MAFEAYKPFTRELGIPSVSLTKTQLNFNILANFHIKSWEAATVAYDKSSGQFAITKAAKGAGLKISHHKDENSAIHATGLIHYFGLEKLIGTKYTIDDKKDFLMLTPIGKGADVPVVPENKTNKICFCKKCGHTENSWKDKRPDKCPKCGSTTFEETIMKKKLEV